MIRPVHAERSGIVQSIATRDVGVAVVALGGGRTRPQDPIDHAVGLTDLAAVGDTVDASRPLAIVHARSEKEARGGSARRARMPIASAMRRPHPRRAFSNGSRPKHEPSRCRHLGDAALGRALPAAPARSRHRRAGRGFRQIRHPLRGHLGSEAGKPLRPAQSRSALLARRRRRSSDELSRSAGCADRARGAGRSHPSHERVHGAALPHAPARSAPLRRGSEGEALASPTVRRPSQATCASASWASACWVRIPPAS